MISTEQRGTVLTNADQESAFRMESSAEAFRILSGDIYEYKSAAMIRELMCNAWDAHLDAGHRLPFHITFPSNLSPYFAIEDFGIGLSEDEVRHVLTVYFKSTKKQQKDSTGFLGLGAKSPLAYTDTFQLRTRKDGMEYNFVSYLNEDGAPVVNMLGSPTPIDPSVSNGVKFTVPVKHQDFNLFFEDARFLASLFEVTPTSNRSDFEPLMPDLRKELDENGVYSPDVNSYDASELYRFSGKSRNAWGAPSTRKYVVMGNVAYRVNEFLLDDSIVPKEVNEFAYRFMTSTYFLKVPMGSVKFTASRESLSMNEQTRRVITEEAVKFYSAQKDKIQREIDEQPTVYDAIRKCHDMTGTLIGLTWFNYGNDLLSRQAHQRLDRILELYDATAFVLNSGNTGSVSKRKFGNSLTGVTLNRSEVASQKITIISPRENNTGIVKYSREYARDNGGRVVSISKPLRKTTMDRLVKLLDDAEIVYVEDLRKIDLDKKKAERALMPKEKTARKTKTEIRAVALKPFHERDYSISGAATYDVSNETDVQYAYIERSDSYSDNATLEIGDETRTLEFNTISQMIYSSQQQMDDPRRLIVLVGNSTNINKIKKNNVPHFNEIIAKVREKFSVDSDFFKLQVKKKIDRKMVNGRCMLLEVLVAIDSPRCTDEMREVYTLLTETERPLTIQHANPWMWNHLVDDIDNAAVKYYTGIEQLDDLMVEGAYPMFDQHRDMKTLCRYVQMEDMFRKVNSI